MLHFTILFDFLISRSPPHSSILRDATLWMLDSTSILFSWVTVVSSCFCFHFSFFLCVHRIFSSVPFVSTSAFCLFNPMMGRIVCTSLPFYLFSQNLFFKFRFWLNLTYRQDFFVFNLHPTPTPFKPLFFARTQSNNTNTINRSIIEIISLPLLKTIHTKEKMIIIPLPVVSQVWLSLYWLIKDF